MRHVYTQICLIAPLTPQKKTAIQLAVSTHMETACHSDMPVSLPVCLEEWHTGSSKFNLYLDFLESKPFRRQKTCDARFKYEQVIRRDLPFSFRAV